MYLLICRSANVSLSSSLCLSVSAISRSSILIINYTTGSFRTHNRWFLLISKQNRKTKTFITLALQSAKSLLVGCKYTASCDKRSLETSCMKMAKQLGNTDRNGFSSACIVTQTHHHKPSFNRFSASPEFLHHFHPRTEHFSGKHCIPLSFCPPPRPPSFLSFSCSLSSLISAS